VGERHLLGEERTSSKALCRCSRLTVTSCSCGIRGVPESDGSYLAGCGETSRPPRRPHPAALRAAVPLPGAARCLLIPSSCGAAPGRVRTRLRLTRGDENGGPLPSSRRPHPPGPPLPATARRCPVAFCRRSVAERGGRRGKFSSPSPWPGTHLVCSRPAIGRARGPGGEVCAASAPVFIEVDDEARDELLAPPLETEDGAVSEQLPWESTPMHRELHLRGAPMTRSSSYMT